MGRRRPGVVVELGCGSSTLALARDLGRFDGRLVTVEHDPRWARRVRGLLADGDGGDDGRAAVLEAPLEPCALALDGARWYAEDSVARLPPRIDLLLVDGPPGNESGIERSRYPALPVLGPRLAPGALVILDDAWRPGEREILRLWEREHPVAFAPAAGGRLALGVYG